MYFPLELPLGKHVPLYGSIPGRIFRLGCHWECMSHPALPRCLLYARALRSVRFSAVGGLR